MHLCVYLSMSVHVCVCMYICMCVQECTFLGYMGYMYKCTSLYPWLTPINARLPAHAHPYVPTKLQINLRVPVWLCTRVCVCGCTHMCLAPCPYVCVCVNTGPSVCSAWGCARTCGCARVMHTPARGPWEWHGPCSVTDGCPWMEVCAQPLCTGMSPWGVHSCGVQGEVWGAAPGAIPAAIPTEVFNLA